MSVFVTMSRRSALLAAPVSLDLRLNPESLAGGVDLSRRPATPCSALGEGAGGGTSMPTWRIRLHESKARSP